MIKLLILVGLAIQGALSEMLRENVVLAINCGGEAFKDSREIQYIEDSFVNGGQSSDFGSQFEIKNTADQAPYQTERWSESDITYSLPLGDGKYVIVLKFSEVYFNSPNEKVFDVFIGSKKVVANVDIFSKVGKSTAYDEFIEIEIKGGRAYYSGKSIENGYDIEEGTLELIFKKGLKDNPKINAILVVKGTLADTDYENFKNQLDDLEKEKAEKERKQREIKKRNSLHYDFEEFEDDFVDTDITKKSGLKLNSLVLIIIVLSIIYFAYSKLKVNDHEKDD